MFWVATIIDTTSDIYCKEVQFPCLSHSASQDRDQTLKKQQKHFSFLFIHQQKEKKKTSKHSFCFFFFYIYLNSKQVKKKKNPQFLFLIAHSYVTTQTLKPINIFCLINLGFSNSESSPPKVLFSLAHTFNYFLSLLISKLLSLFVCCMKFTLLSFACYGDDNLGRLWSCVWDCCVFVWSTTGSSVMFL